MSAELITIRGKKNGFTQTIERTKWDTLFKPKGFHKHYDIVSTEIIETNTFIPKEVQAMLPKAKPKLNGSDSKEKSN